MGDHDHRLPPGLPDAQQFSTHAFTGYADYSAQGRAPYAYLHHVGFWFVVLAPVVGVSLSIMLVLKLILLAFIMSFAVTSLGVLIAARVVQGLGQALLENCAYDADSGQPMTASFTAYAMPRADDMPDIAFAYEEHLCKTNPMGAKGCGEAGTVGAMPAVISAVSDAIGVAHIDMPATPEKVWRALQSAA